jgi:hypothetical protein
MHHSHPTLLPATSSNQPSSAAPQAWRKSHHWWMRWLPLGALALQFPASCLILLWWNSTPCTPKLGAHARSCGVMGTLQWLVAATFLLPVGIPLLDVVAVCLLVKSGIQAVDRVPKGPLGWLLFGTMEWLRWLAVPAANAVYCCVMRPLRALCSARDLPSVAALLNGPFQYREAVDVVWAENYKFARVPLHALLGSLPLVRRGCLGPSVGCVPVAAEGADVTALSLHRPRDRRMSGRGRCSLSGGMHMQCCALAA